ncbi:MAG: 5-carboxymethyl-2-hydroxymuconate isomerase [Deltaproteobacteria bacterium RIFOXYD12_FULL_57_12]|nr:MAG: 5-carboxymethyl-2-hydroxymuconate isomerase [Deltaproteobacteria bacterium RIFOXYD12_FULL_57_12]
MRIIRFLDDGNQERFGHDFRDGTAALLTGMPQAKLRNAGRRLRVAKLLAPVAPAAILCVGLNYAQHARELGIAAPRYPVLFMKNPAALNHPGDPILLPPSCQNPPQVDFEAELAVVIGRAAKNVSATQALDYVLGYTIGNDISARQWQQEAGAGQWVRGKSFDTFCPLGPELVTPDLVADPQDLRIVCTLNGKTMQDASTADMIFPVAELIEYLSDDMTLLPNTVILTGTPAGVGFTREPAVFLQPGDLVEVSIAGLGMLRSPVAAG